MYTLLIFPLKTLGKISAVCNNDIALWRISCFDPTLFDKGSMILRALKYTCIFQQETDFVRGGTHLLHKAGIKTNIR